MKRFFGLFVSAAVLLSIGCAQRTYYAPPPPPPPPQAVPPLVGEAEHNGFRAGVDDGTRDAFNGFGYHPKHDRNFQETPGYDPRLGPYGPYQSYFRSAYLRGYDRGFYRR
jgi:hypothetical protein